MAGQAVPRFWVPVTQHVLLPLSSVKELTFFSDQRRAIMLGKISTAFTYPFYKCALLYHNPVSLCVNGCQGLSHTKCLSVSASQPTS